MLSSFTVQRPAIAYSHVKHETKGSEHPIASQIPKASTQPAIVGDPDKFLDLMRPTGSPLKLNDYVNSDRPQLGLHIVSFADMTLVVLYWPHTLFDAMGKKALLNAWTLMLKGRDDEIRSPYGAETDPFVDLGTAPTERHELEAQKMGILGLLGFGVRQLLSFVYAQENRIVCVPGQFVRRLRDSAITELATARKGMQMQNNFSSGNTTAEGQPFLSEGDVLCAWWTRYAVAHLPNNCSQMVVLNNAYDIRKSLSGDLIPEGTSYLSNAIGFINVLLSVKDIKEKPHSYVASHIRNAIMTLGTRSQVEAFFAMLRESRIKLPPFFGNSNMHMVTFSNWTKANLFELDFSAALVDQGANPARIARPRYIQNNQFGLTMPNAFPIIGKDNDGNYWLSGYMNTGHWAKIEELLASEV